VTNIAFHFGASDRLAYVCRLLRKASAAGARVAVLADRPTLEQIDADLWAVGATDFVPHCLYPADQAVAARSSVGLHESAFELKDHFPVLLNLMEGVPEGFDAFDRVIEVVSQDEADRQQARLRWKAYSARGYIITRHDIASRAEV